MNNPLQNVTLIMEKDILKRELFSTRLMVDKRNHNFRIPGNLSQEHMPLGFKYYNCLIPMLQQLNRNIKLKMFAKYSMPNKPKTTPSKFKAFLRRITCRSTTTRQL